MSCYLGPSNYDKKPIDEIVGNYMLCKLLIQ